MSQEPSDPRGGYRFLAGLEARILFGETGFSCEAVDLHRQGALVEGDFDPEGQTEAGIHLRSVANDLLFEAHGRVAYVSKDPDSGRFRVGIEFDTVAPEQLGTLEFLLARVIEGRNPAPLASLERGASISEIRKALDKIPLPHRIMVAHRAQTLERGFLKHDESPQVIEALSRNPQLTRPEVIQLLRMPNLLQTTLESLSRDPRWMSNEEIKIMIATHPRATFPIAERMVKNLSIVGIRRVIRSPGLNAAIKDRLVQTIPHKQLQGW